MKKEQPITTQTQDNELTTPVEQVEATTATELAADGSATTAKKKKFFTAGNMAVMGILTAIAYVLYLLPHFVPVFNLPFFPPWLDIQISDLPALLGGFAIGPWASVIIIVIKCALKMPFTSTNCVGELADIIVGIAFVLPASLLYKKMKGKKGALIGMLVGTVSAVAISVLANWLVLVPFYAWFYGQGDATVGWSIILKAVSTIYEDVTRDSFYKYYLTMGVIPFNLMRCAICAIITYFVYKPLSKALHWEIQGKKKAAEASENSLPTDEQSVNLAEEQQEATADTVAK